MKGPVWRDATTGSLTTKAPRRGTLLVADGVEVPEHLEPKSEAKPKPAAKRKRRRS